MTSPENPPTPEEARKALEFYDSGFDGDPDYLAFTHGETIRAALSHLAQADSQKGDEAVAWQVIFDEASFSCRFFATEDEAILAADQSEQVRPLYTRHTDGQNDDRAAMSISAEPPQFMTPRNFTKEEIAALDTRPDGLTLEMARALIRVKDELEAVTSLLENGPIRPDPKSTRILLAEQAQTITKAQEIMGKRDAG